MKKRLTELVFIIDRSGSMSGLEDDTIGGFNAMLQEQKAVEGEAVVTTVLFSDGRELFHDRINIQAVAPLARADYTVGGSTALLDAIGIAIHKIRKAQRSTSEQYRAEKVLFVIITDGHENASRHYTADMIKKRIEYQKQKYGWEFIFFGANMDAIMEAQKIGINADRAHSYFADSFGTQSAYATMSAMSSMFRTTGSIDNSLTANRPQAALKNINSVADGLRKVAGELMDEVAEILRVAVANGGKHPDVHKIVRQVLSEQNKKENE